MSKINLHLRRGIYLVLGAAALNTAMAAETGGLEEVVVTAQKRAESIQDVPVAISAYTSETRDLVGITTVQDLTNYSPGITYSASLDRMTVRGIGRSTNNLSIDPSVATYGDGFYNSSNHQADASTLFVDRVEILRGPQGTLYGRNSIGGALNVISKRPSSEFGGEVRTDIGNYKHHDVEGVITGPITDWLNFKLGAGEYRQDEGFVHNNGGLDEWGRRDNVFAQGQLSAKFGDAVDVWVKVEHADWDEGYGGSFGLSADPYYTAANVKHSAGTDNFGHLVLPAQLLPNPLYNAAPGLYPVSAADQFTTLNPRASDPRTVNHDTPAHDWLHGENQYVLEVVSHLGFADLKYTGGYHAYRYTLFVDWDNSNRSGYTYTPTFTGFVPGVGPTFINSHLVGRYIEDKHYYSNELNLISTTDGPLQYVFGAYQYNERFDQPFDITDVGQQQLLNPCLVPNFTNFTCTVRGAANPAYDVYLTDQKSLVQSAAVYSQLDWKMSDSWKSTLGVRYTEDRKSTDEFTRQIYWDPTQLGNLFPALDITNPTNAAGQPLGTRQADGTVGRRLDGKWHATTGTAGFEWSPQSGMLGYVKYSRGYKSGGINAGSLVPQPFTDPEHVNAYELGWKQTIASSFQTNISAFYYDYKGSQIPFSVPQNNAPNRTDFLNVDLKNYGVEFENTWQATDNLLFLLNYAYLHTEIVDKGCFIDPLAVSGIIGPRPCVIPGTAVAGQRIEGNVAPGSPKNKAVFNVLYTFHFTPGSLALSGSYAWRDAVWSSVVTTDVYKVPSYGQTDLRATWTDAGNNYSVIGYMRNAGDTLGYDGVAATLNATQTGIVRTLSYTNPRTYGVQFQYRFGSSAK